MNDALSGPHAKQIESLRWQLGQYVQKYDGLASAVKDALLYNDDPTAGRNVAGISSTPAKLNPILEALEIER